MTRLSRTAGRLSVGSRTYARRLGTRAAAWCARGRRSDLPGWRGALGIFVRIALLVLGVYVLARIVRSLPALMWLLTGWWTIASWRAGKPAAEEPEKAPAGPDAGAVRTLLLDLMGTGNGVHLRTVLKHLQEHGQWEGRTVSDLRAHLGRLDIPVDRGVKVARVPTWGVRRRDLQAPSPAEPQEASTGPSTAA
ncbi:hypothetical protein [Streptomyces stelliscabiei]|uniref:hypothetical protein n=1 Tax=Streptomyces stelliscabiei TaxID=146820 RepID=UPI0029A0A5C0|nr:hypothetical protein [Streptomyces stelliscabiei]MDX2616128.1 hypothetical protein [Streptomyces stelliscabiei]MDX2634184.1 hypothetical protein [Streptomyces stelliscabiei]MDX2664605.1 hypothetical protein [Streptomyces stelliscabiei]MDX2713832.1 hypothetical protein [Streptomyces stelliscabiei]MDX2785772.1 hypothetical protein [Streptomyces stelliscabiei]